MTRTELPNVTLEVLTLAFAGFVWGDERAGDQPPADTYRSQEALLRELARARGILPRCRWFEVIALPNDVYALWEPGHVEKIKSFLIVGSEKEAL